MFFKTFFAAFAMALVSYAAPTPIAGATPETLVERGAIYRLYTGDGSNWPAISAWTTFDAMWTNNQAVMSTSCSQFFQPNNSPRGNRCDKAAITSTASSSGVDERFILAIVMQESGGCVRAPSSAGQVFNHGLMQDHNGSNSCNRGGAAQTPCPAATIAGMIQDGTVGTLDQPGGGDGLKQCLAQSGFGKTDQAAYVAARIYNSGSYTEGTDLGAPAWGTSCYSSDVANRLLGWAGSASPCTLPNPSH